jgi:UDP-glucose 4-epimerase
VEVKILLLGASGFTGANLLPRLQASGSELYALGSAATTDEAGIRWLTEADLAGARLSELDVIVAVADAGSLASYQADPGASLAIEAANSDLVCSLAVKTGARRVLYISCGAAIYGEGWRDKKKTAFQETEACQPISIFGKCKQAGEMRLIEQMNAAKIGNRLAILRAGNIYGLHAAGNGGLVNTLIEHALGKQPVTIYGDGLCYRDYLYASDLASAVMKAARSEVCGFFNIAAGSSHSILEVAGEVERALGLGLEMQFEAARAFDVKYSAFHIAKAET